MHLSYIQMLTHLKSLLYKLTHNFCISYICIYTFKYLHIQNLFLMDWPMPCAYIIDWHACTYWNIFHTIWPIVCSAWQSLIFVSHMKYCVIVGYVITKIDSLPPGGVWPHFECVILRCDAVITFMSISNSFAFRRMVQDPTDDKSTLVQVMAWCSQKTSHYLHQCWLRSMTLYGVTRPQWV